MTVHVKIGGAWKNVTAAFVKVSGAWKEVNALSVRVGGAWKDVSIADPALDAAALTAWGDLSIASPASSDDNEDRTITWSVGGARNISASYSGGGTLQYRIDSGSWTTYSAPFSLSSGQTLGWRVTTVTDNQSATNVTVTDATRGATLDTFSVTATGFGASSLAATLDPTSVNGGTVGNGSQSYGSCQINATGGTPPYSYEWEQVSGDAISPTSGFSQVTLWTSNATDQSLLATWRGKVTDAAMNSVYTSNSTDISVTHGTPP